MRSIMLSGLIVALAAGAMSCAECNKSADESAAAEYRVFTSCYTVSKKEMFERMYRMLVPGWEIRRKDPVRGHIETEWQGTTSKATRLTRRGDPRRSRINVFIVGDSCLRAIIHVEDEYMREDHADRWMWAHSTDEYQARGMQRRLAKTFKDRMRPQPRPKMRGLQFDEVRGGKRGTGEI